MVRIMTMYLVFKGKNRYAVCENGKILLECGRRKSDLIYNGQLIGFRFNNEWQIYETRIKALLGDPRAIKAISDNWNIKA